MLVVIVTFSELHAERVIDVVGDVPYVGRLLQAPFEELLHRQKTSLHLGAKTVKRVGERD